MKFFTTNISKDQSRDTGMAMVLLCMLLAVSPKHPHGYLYAAMALQVVNMIFPQIFRPVAVVWLGFSNLLGEIAPKILLSIVFLDRKSVV